MLDEVTLVEGDAHQKVTQLDGPIDIVFVDESGLAERPTRVRT